jgi:integrase/recombinase XerD
MQLSKAAEGFILAKRADGRKPGAIKAIVWSQSRLLARFGEREVESITTAELREFIVGLSNDPEIHARSRQMIVLHSKALFRWLRDEGYIQRRPDEKIKVPSAPQPNVQGFSEEEVRRMLKAAMHTRITKGEHSYTIHNPLGIRNRAVLLALLSTGCRAGELCALNMGDVSLETGEVRVQAAKTNMPRTTYLDNAARKAIWKYLAARGEWRPAEPLFLSDERDRMTPHSLHQLMLKIGKRAKVENVHPHRWRHTFAIQFLKNGGDLARLRILLGHRNIAVTAIYTNFAQPDVAAIHAATSAGDRWRL